MASRPWRPKSDLAMWTWVPEHPARSSVDAYDVDFVVPVDTLGQVAGEFVITAVSRHG